MLGSLKSTDSMVNMLIHFMLNFFLVFCYDVEKLTVVFSMVPKTLYSSVGTKNTFDIKIKNCFCAIAEKKFHAQLFSSDQTASNDKQSQTEKTLLFYIFIFSPELFSVHVFHIRLQLSEREPNESGVDVERAENFQQVRGNFLDEGFQEWRKAKKLLAFEVNRHLP